MSIKKQYFKTKKDCRVTFTVPESQGNGAQKVYVVGEFNGWSTTATPMKRSKKGDYKVSLDLQKGQEYQFRYLLDGLHWENEAEADKSANTPYADARNSVIVT